MFIYSSPLAKIENIKNVNDVLAVLRAQGFYDLPAVKNNKYTPDINELAKSIYELIQHSSPEVKALIGEVLKLTPQTVSQEQILDINIALMELILKTLTQKQYSSLQPHFYLLGCYFDTMIAGCEQ